MAWPSFFIAIALTACGGSGGGTEDAAVQTPLPPAATGSQDQGASSPAPESTGPGQTTAAQALSKCRVTSGPETTGPDGTDYLCMVGTYDGTVPSETAPTATCRLVVAENGDVTYTAADRSLALPKSTWRGSTLYNKPTSDPPLFNWSVVTPQAFIMVVRPAGLAEAALAVTAAPLHADGTTDAANAPLPCMLH